MTKNTHYLDKQDTSAGYSGSQTYRGTFIGTLQGNADTATALQNPMTLSFVGDVTGSGVTAGSSTQIRMHVSRADTADHANVADTATKTLSADTAKSATFAANANFAQKAGSATNAVNAERAKVAEEATNASRAELAVTASSANTAKTAEFAVEAGNAKTANKALVADKLSADAPAVPHAGNADHAEYAHVAVMAQHDCEGKSFTHYYALKSDIPTDWMTESEACNKFVPRNEQILQAIVSGRATGRGVTQGNTLHILIDEIAARPDGSGNVYDDIEFCKTFSPVKADTTKIYIDYDGFMYVYDVTGITQGGDVGESLPVPLNERDNCPAPPPLTGRWIKISADISPQLKKEIGDALAQIRNVVTITGDQTISGKKIFTERVQAEIPTMLDDPRTVTVVHNLLDLKKQVDYDLLDYAHKVDDRFEQIEDLINGRHNGTVQFAYKDYTLVANQEEMHAGVIYFAYFTEDKKFIQYSPNNHQPVDPSQTPRYIRSWYKDSSGAVSFTDRDLKPDLSGYMPITGGEFTGDISTPDLPFVTNDSRVLNSKGVHLLVKHVVLDFDTKLTNYMPISGGQFTGPVGGQYVGDVTTANDQTILVKGDILKLIDENSASLIVLPNRPAHAGELQPLKLYAFPADINPNAILSAKIFDEPINDDPVNNEVFIFPNEKSVIADED